MWVFTDSGYLSIVQANDDPTTLVVRARVKGDLDALRRVHVQMHGGRQPQVLVYDNSDYPWRILTSRTAVASFLTGQVSALDYGNFKDAIAQRQGKPRASVYSNVWTALLRLMDLDTPTNRRKADARWTADESEGYWWESATPERLT